MVISMKKYKIHHLNTEVAVTGLVNVSYYKLPKNYRDTAEHHDFWELVYVDKGELVAMADGERHLLKAGELVFHRPNEIHALEIYDFKPANIIVISFCCDSPVMKTFERKILLLNPQEKAYLSQIVQEVESAYVSVENEAPFLDLWPKEDAPFASEQIIRSALEMLLILIYRRDDSIRYDSRIISPSQLHHHARAVYEVQDYLHEHFGDRITLEMLAARQNISVTQLKRIFKEQTGTTIISYLTDFRIGEAKRMIQEGNLNFTQIALAVGYDNIYYFSTLFKKQTGMTLSEYSKSVRR